MRLHLEFFMATFQSLTLGFFSQEVHGKLSNVDG